MEEIFTRSFSANELNYKVTFEPVHDELLGELYYLVTMDGQEPFIMKIDNETGTFKVEGSAPYDARIHETQLSDMIEAYNA